MIKAWIQFQQQNREEVAFIKTYGVQMLIISALLYAIGWLYICAAAVIVG